MRATHLRIWTLAGLPLVVGLAGAPAAADPVIYYHAGAWHAFTDKNNSGTDVCGIGTENSSDGRTLSLTYTIGGTQLHFDAAKPTWNIPEGTQVDFSLQIDQNQPWPGQAIGHGTHLDWDLGADSIRQFDSQFRSGVTLTLSFPSGNEPPWQLSLAGSTAAAQTLWRCVHDLSVRDHVVTPPQNTPSAAATQPYGQAPTQPYAAQPNQGQAQPSQPTPGNLPPPASAPPATPPANGATQPGNNPPPPAPTQPNATQPTQP